MNFADVATRRLRFRSWVAASLLLTLGVMGSSVIAAILLDAFARRPAPMSVTTLFPGFVYAAATVMKVCMVTGFVALLAAAASALMLSASQEGAAPRMPLGALTSLALPTVIPLVGGMALLAGQELVALRATWTVAEASNVSRMAVFLSLAIISTGVAFGIVSLVRGERPRPLAMLGILANAVLLGLFLHLRFHTLGFDQDTWARP